MKKYYSLGLDFGTNSVRALILDLMSGEELATQTSGYPSGDKGIIIDRRNPHLARQHPGDYPVSMVKAVEETIEEAVMKGLHPDCICGIGVDTTGSTPLPIDKKGIPLGVKDEYKDNLNAQAWLWKDHTAAEEAALITSLASEHRPHFLKKCGGAYSSEWFFSKIFHCYHADRNLFDKAYSWIELSDYIPALLCGINNADQIKRNVCAAGHKAMYSKEWGGLPDADFLGYLSPQLAELRKRLYTRAETSDQPAGKLAPTWAKELGLKPDIPVAVGALDAHLGAVGSGIKKGVLVKIIGTSTCDIMVYPENEPLQDIPGVAGIVKGSVIPDHFGIEAGQSAVGDIFNWFVTRVLNEDENYHRTLSEKASSLRAGQSGLLGLDWNNGNRNILTDPNLTGLLIGQTLHTADYEIYRALIEATAFGAKRIIEQMENYGVKIEKVINCGGIAEKNPLVMQIYADVLDKPMEIAHSVQTVALGAAIFGGIAALKGREGFSSVEEVQDRVCKVKDRKYYAEQSNSCVYKKLYTIYKSLHDSFGIKDKSTDLYHVMKELLVIKRQVES